MPTRDSSTNPDDGEDMIAGKERDRDRDRDSERPERGDRGGGKQKSLATAASKSLYSASHCFFFLFFMNYFS
jgi:hypothetical protein